MSPPPGGSAAFYSHIPVDLNDPDKDEGPATIGIKSAKKRLLALATIASYQDSKDGKTYISKEGEREEWMLIPGDHNFLKEINGVTVLGRIRRFNHEKTRSGNNAVVLEVPEIAEARDEIEDIF